MSQTQNTRAGRRWRLFAGAILVGVVLGGWWLRPLPKPARVPSDAPSAEEIEAARQQLESMGYTGKDREGEPASRTAASQPAP